MSQELWKKRTDEPDGSLLERYILTIDKQEMGSSFGCLIFVSVLEKSSNLCVVQQILSSIFILQLEFHQSQSSFQV